MRLLNTTTKKVEEFLVDPTPKYAILSHTWAEQEVAFQDVDKPGASAMAGYQKIVDLCKQADKDGLEYAWIDTCCIDKTSSSELSEAINSMFSWYQAAHVCYAYLADVSRDDFEAEMRASRWFKRGWTLQELLAPERVVFYGKGWVRLGEKNGMSGLISSITGIHELALRRPRTIPAFSIASRMHWAHKRRTSRVEDSAYCMLGIFGVNIPLLYGEGAKAFTRLQEELIRSSDDESLFTGNILNSGDLFAQGPSGFVNGKEIVPVRSKAVTSPYSMTNKGLYIRLPLLEEESGRDGEFLGILNCVRTDLSSYIAIPLQATSIPDTFIRRSSSASVKLSTVSEEEYLKASCRTIYIRRSQSLLFTSTCWVRSGTLEHQGYLLRPNFYHFFNSWDEKNQVSRVDHDWFHHLRCFTFVHPDFGTAFAVVLYLNAIKETGGVVMFMKMPDQPLDVWERSLSWGALEEAVEDWESEGLPLSTTRFLLEPSPSKSGVEKYEIKASVSREEKLKQDIWVLDVVSTEALR